MTLLSEAVANTDDADLMVLACIETVRDQQQPATASAVASLIGGARGWQIADRLHKLWKLKLVELAGLDISYRAQLTELGAELLRQELIGWTPSNREETRRQDEMRVRLAKVLGS